MQADIRITKQECGRSFSIKMPKENYGLSEEDVRKLKLTIEKIGGNFKKQRIPVGSSSVRTFNIPISFVDHEILKYL